MSFLDFLSFLDDFSFFTFLSFVDFLVVDFLSFVDFFVVDFLSVVDFFVVDFLSVDFFPVDLAWFGKARQCAFVFTPFLFVDALRQEHVLLELHCEAVKPTHWLFAAAAALKNNKTTARLTVTIVEKFINFLSISFFYKQYQEIMTS